MATTTYTKTGTKATTAAKLDATIFGLEVKNHSLLKQAYETYLANGRTNNAVTKTRGLVRGGGRKPWAQKGTGRARFGSSRNPIWRGGGIVFGPTGEENYSKSLNVKAKRQALRHAFSLKSQSDQIIVIEDIDIKSAKTADLAKLLTKIGVSRKILLVVDAKSPELIRASNNLQEVIVTSASHINVYDLINANFIVMTNAALEHVTNTLKKEDK